MKKISESISGVNFDIKEFLVGEWMEQMQIIGRLSKVETDHMACGEQDHHHDQVAAAMARIDAIDLVHAGYKNMQQPSKEKYNIIITSRSGIGVIKHFNKNNIETLVILQKFLSDQWIINFYSTGESK